VSRPTLCNDRHPKHPFYVCTRLVGHDGPHRAEGTNETLAEWGADASAPLDPLERRVLQCEQAILELSAAFRSAGFGCEEGVGSLPSPSKDSSPAEPSADARSTIPA
jgi:hypothetical protein